MPMRYDLERALRTATDRVIGFKDLLATGRAESSDHFINLREIDPEAFADEVVLNLELRRALYATYAVLIAQVVEAFCAMLVPSDHLGSRPHFDDYRRYLEKQMGKKFADVDGFSEVELVRCLANCFKHSDMRANPEASKLLRIKEDEPLQFENHLSSESVANGCFRFLKIIGESI